MRLVSWVIPDLCLLSYFEMRNTHLSVLNNLKDQKFGHVRKFVVLSIIFWAIYDLLIKFGSKLYRQIVGIPMGTNCAPLVADLFLFCYERDFMLSLSDNNQADVAEVLNSTSRYLDDLLNIDNL